MILSSRHLLSFVTVISLLTGCDAGSPRPAPAPIPVDAPTFTTAVTASEPGGIVSVTLTSVTADSKKVKSVVAASRPFTFGGIVTTSTVGGGRSSADYDVTYQESVEVPTALSIPFVLKNESERVLTLNGVVMRVKADVAGVQGSIPKEITNDTKLAPGETIAGTLIIEHLAAVAPTATVTATFYEIPLEILDNGQVGKRGSIVKTITITRVLATIPCSAYTMRETRTWMDGGNDDPALRKFLR